MWINFSEFKKCLDETGIPSYRDKAEKGIEYPYLVYQLIGEKNKRAGNIVFEQINQYQISYYTKGVENELRKVKAPFDKRKTPYEDFEVEIETENEEIISNFYTYVDVIIDE